MAASWPPLTWSSEATEPTMPCWESAAASRVAAPSLRDRLSSRASSRARAAGAVALGEPLGLAVLLDLGLDLLEDGGGLLVGRVEPLLALLVDGDRGLEGPELLLGLGGAAAATAR